MRRVERWAGLTRTVSNWDGLRRDPELWDEDGDCLVHLYAVGQSRRGPSICVPFRVLKKSKCGPMFSLCFAQTTRTTASHHASSNVKRPPGQVSRKIELYIPAPDDNSREASFQWHITTRNFFAFISGKPLVGNSLGQAMIDLQERMCLFRSGLVDNHREFLAYADAQGYRDFVDFPDYALAMLYYAEHYKLRDAWIDAFAHCVGMNDKLVLSPEFPPQSRLTKALITRACLEMDIELSRTTAAIRSFLEDDFSTAHLGLTTGARNHLDRFRSFLHSYYVDKFGYWPPPKGTTFSKALFRSLYFDFKDLYDHLVDSESTADLASQKLASGGICVLQNVDSFDQRHRFPPLPHPLPLIPCEVPSSTSKRTRSQKSFRSLAVGTKQVKDERHLSVRAALIMATNGESEAPLIQAYMRSEQQCVASCSEEKTCMADARKVRWILIYGTLQYLISALRAPTEVRDTEGPKYHLNCLVTEPAQWQIATTPTSVSTTHVVVNPIDKYMDELDTSPIEPDCQSYDYFQHTNTDPGSRRVSVEISAPLKISQPSRRSSRNSSVRSRRRLSMPSLGSNRNSISLKPQTHCEILVHGYGNGLNNAYVDAPPEVSSGVPSRASTVNTALKKRSSHATIVPEPSWLKLSTPESTSHHCDQRSRHIGPYCIATMDPLRTLQHEAAEWDHTLKHPLLIDDSTKSLIRHASLKTNSPDSTSSHSWSDGVSSASSISSTYDEQVEAKITPAEESGLLGGLVSITSSSPFRFNKAPSSVEAFSARTSDIKYGIGVAITDSNLSALDVLSSPIALPTTGSALADKKIPSMSRRSSSFRQVMGLPMSSTATPGKVSISPDQSTIQVGPPFVTKIKKESRLSFWKR